MQINDLFGNRISVGDYLIFDMKSGGFLARVNKIAIGTNGIPYLSCISAYESYSGNYNIATSVIKRFDKTVLIGETFAASKYPEAYARIISYYE